MALSLLASSHALGNEPLLVYAREQRLVTLKEGRRLNVDCRGKGSPTIILESGLGSSTVTWRAVHDELSLTTLTCAYDRAGIGFSDPGPLPRSAKNLAGDLTEMLEVAGIDSPYILIAHSIGAIVARRFATLHPGRIAGIVLVDPSVEHQMQRLDSVSQKASSSSGQTITNHYKKCISWMRQGNSSGADAAATSDCVGRPTSGLPDSVNAAIARSRLRLSFHESVLSEFESLLEAASTERVTELTKLGAIPLIVLTAGATFQSESTEVDVRRKIWEELHRETTRLSTCAMHRGVPGARHSIQLTQPAAVIEAVKQVYAGVGDICPFRDWSDTVQ